MDGHERPSNRVERGRVRAGGSREVLPQGYDRKEADEADDDDRGFNDTSGDIAKGDAFAWPLEDGKQHDRGADVGDGKNDLFISAIAGLLQRDLSRRRFRRRAQRSIDRSQNAP
jgi:hypothetical protein